MTKLSVTMLGCGSSGGVPFIGCDCEICTSTNPRNKRTRVSALVNTQGKSLLIDTSPDLRQQALRENVRRVDAVLYTHDHADHIGGIDDIRSFNWLADDAIPAYGDPHTIDNITSRFSYIFQPRPEIWSRGSMIAHKLQDKPIVHFDAAGVPVTAIRQQHGKGHSLGYRIGNFAYSTDANGFSDEAAAALEGLDVWIVDCLRYKPAPTHAHLEMALGWISQLKPKLAILTHMSHEFDYEALSRELPSGVVVGYDGLHIAL